MDAISESQKEIIANNLLREAGVLNIRNGCMSQAHCDARFYARHIITNIPPDTFAVASMGRCRGELALELLNTLALKEEDRWPLYYLLTHSPAQEAMHFLSWSDDTWMRYFKRLQKRYGSFWEGWFTVYLEEVRRERRVSHASDFNESDF